MVPKYGGLGLIAWNKYMVNVFPPASLCMFELNYIASKVRISIVRSLPRKFYCSATSFKNLESSWRFRFFLDYKIDGCIIRSKCVCRNACE